MASPRCTVIGGGLAGLAAACGLAAYGLRVTVLESRPRLGGRAASFPDPDTGAVIDNCQHVAMGCCTAFRAFTELVGIDRLMRTEKTLNFIGPDHSVTPFRANWWPAPFHLARAFGRLPYLSPRHTRQFAFGLRRLARLTEDQSEQLDWPFSQWLQHIGQPPEVVERVWHTVLVSALSESLDRIETRYARKVFVDGFLMDRQAWQVQIPNGPLDELYGRQLSDWLQRRGAQIHTSAGVESLVGRPQQIEGVRLRSGKTDAAEEFILAVPWHRVTDLLSQPLQDQLDLPLLERIQSAPISSVHLWFDRPITNLPHAVFMSGLCQWIFHRESSEMPAICRETDGSVAPHASYYYQVVISASRDLQALSQRDVIDQVVDELRAAFPAAEDAELQHGRLITEHKAVFSVLPGIDRLRPTQQTSIPNLQLAGDWTRTGWPATMEGAVRSGFHAAENILARYGHKVRLVPPETRPALLSKYLFDL